MASSSVLHTLANRTPRSKSRKERQKEVALSRYAPLVKYVVDRLALHLPKSVERDDLISAAIIGLFDALEKYDASKGTKFETYAIWRIRGAILDQIETDEAREVLLETIDGLPEQQRLVVALYYYEEMTLKEIGEALHISESRVSQIHTRAVKTLKARLGRIL